MQVLAQQVVQVQQLQAQFPLLLLQGQLVLQQVLAGRLEQQQQVQFPLLLLQEQLVRQLQVLVVQQGLPLAQVLVQQVVQVQQLQVQFPLSLLQEQLVRLEQQLLAQFPLSRLQGQSEQQRQVLVAQQEQQGLRLLP